MRKTLCSLVLVVCTALLSFGMVLGKPAETPLQARIVTVSRNDVHQVVAISGRVRYADESIAYARTSGVVSDICVTPGQRLAAGEALIRLDAVEQETAISAFVSGAQKIAEYLPVDEISEQLSLENAVVRSSEICTVRQVLIEKDSLVTAGMPVVRLSSNEQEIVCSVSTVDARRITPGMWAWTSTEGEFLCFAEVISVGEAEVDPLTGMLVSSVILQPEKHIELPEGTAIDAEVYIAGSDDVLSLPVEAITESDTVWWVDQGRCTEIPAQIVMSDEMHAWVNLPEGIQVAIGEFEEGQFLVEASE